jgi:type IV pilus assembly protein PilB
MPEVTANTIEDILASLKILTPDQVSQVKLEQINTGKQVRDILLEKGWASEKDILGAQARILNIPVIDLKDRPIGVEVLSKIPEAVAQHYILMPFGIEAGQIQVAMSDPLDLQVIEFLETKSGMRVKPYVAPVDEIQAAIETNYAQSIDKDVRAALREAQTETTKIEESIKDISKLGDAIRDAPVARIVSTMLEYAAKSRASDVHIEPGEENTRVRYRIDGVLQERLVLPNKVHDSVISRIKILSNLKIDEKRIPQDGRFQIQVGEQQIDLRVSTLPTSMGEKVVMRLLRKDSKVPTFAELGIRGNALKSFENALAKTAGIVLVTGPTGSGKTTTLRTALTKLNSVKVNIITLEDPVEYQVPGVNQVQINPAAGLTFASGLRSILRQDPNVIMVGEIRDGETMELAIQASLTGHLVLSTLHTNSAAGALPRLLDMGAEPFLVASSVNVIMAQRLVRQLCQKCRVAAPITPEVEQQIKQSLGNLMPKESATKQPIVYQPKGCSACNNLGYEGRAGIYEVLEVSEKIGRLILQRESADKVQAEAVAAGMITMKQDGFLKVLEGLTTFEEVLRVIS